MTARCQFCFTQGPAPSTRCVYLSAQGRYVNFCHQDGRLSPDGTLLPANEQSLMGFATVLAGNLQYSSIKVYLSAVQSFHINNGFLDPLVNCLQLQSLLRGIKHVQGSSPPKRLPLTLDLLQVIHRSLDLNSKDHVMLWAACCLGFFGFLRAGKFTTNSPFDPSIHLMVSDLQADALVDATCFRVHINCSKTLTCCLTWSWVPQVWSLGAVAFGHEPPLLQAVPSRRSFRHGRWGSWLGCG